ncbi:MAG: hypothetical protein V3V06_06420 [Dehalococcoidia bacterium]
MREQYVATDKRTGVEVAVTGEFPPHPDDRVRIARTTTLFTRLMATLLGKDESDRRAGFRAVETQLELADALIRQDMEEIRRLVRQTMESMGVTEDQLEELARQLRELGGMDEASADDLTRALGLNPEPEPGSPADELPPQPPSIDSAQESAGPDEATDSGSSSDDPSSQGPKPQGGADADTEDRDPPPPTP